VLPKSLSRDEVEATLGATQPRINRARPGFALRDRAMLKLLYAGGVRVSELQTLAWRLELEMGYIWCVARVTRSALPIGIPANISLQST